MSRDIGVEGAEETGKEMSVVKAPKKKTGQGGKLVLIISSLIVLFVIMVPIMSMSSGEVKTPEFNVMEDMEYYLEGSTYKVCELDIDEMLEFVNRYGNPAKYWNGTVKNTYGQYCFKVTEFKGENYEIVFDTEVDDVESCYGIITNITKEKDIFMINMKYCEV